MLDNFLGNVFGRSKKSSTASGAGGGGPQTHNTHTTAADNDSFVVLPPNGPIDGHTTDDHSLYPRMGTLLTQEMIVNSNSQSAGQSSSSLAPTVAQRTCAQTYSSPIDNIPFTTLMSGSGNDWLVDNNQRALNKSFETIDRIQQYLSTASQSEYSFHLENNILSESLLQS